MENIKTVKNYTKTKPKRPKKPKKIIREPRAKGLTITNRTKTHQHTKELLVKEYLDNNFTINDQYLNIPQLSTKYDIPLKEIYKYIGEYQNHLSSLLDNPEAIQQQTLALTSTLLNGTLESRGLIAQQVALLIRSQGDTYKPFISSEVTKALKLGLESNDSLLKAINLLSGNQGPNTNILIQGGFGAVGPSDSEAFTPSQAVQLLADQGLQDKSLTEAHHKALYIEHELKDAPEVCAKFMEAGEEPTLSIDTIPDKDLEFLDHENRRESDLGVVDTDEV